MRNRRDKKQNYFGLFACTQLKGIQIDFANIVDRQQELFSKYELYNNKKTYKLYIYKTCTFEETITPIFEVDSNHACIKLCGFTEFFL